MEVWKWVSVVAFGVLSFSTPDASSEEADAASNKRVSTIELSQLKERGELPPVIRTVFENGLQLTRRGLSYQYGGADPDAGGMDCSGFVYYVLRSVGVENVPRSSAAQYIWLRKAGTFRSVLSHDEGSFEFDELRPGDLLFWTGTYKTGREIPVSHVQMYLGRLGGDGRRVMIGASEGRTFAGKRRYGVSVFDFRLPKPGSKARFVGYARVPGLGKSDE